MVSTSKQYIVEQSWIDSVKALPEYRYGEESPSLWDVFIDDLMRFLKDLISEVADGKADTTVDFIGYAIVIALVILIVRTFITSGRNPLSYDRSRAFTVDQKALAPSEDIDRLIGIAVSDHRFREAVRLLYLRALADMRDASIINWQIDKTDTDYVREVRGRWQHDVAFARAVRSFQSTWYGDQSVDSITFNNIREQFDALRRSM